MVSTSLRRRQASVQLTLSITEQVLHLRLLLLMTLIGTKYLRCNMVPFSGITPAISDEMTNICITACQKAKEKGMTVSCDLNYRSKLWSSEKACEAMSRICQYVDVCIANEDDAIGIFSMNPAELMARRKMLTLPGNL